MDDVNRMPNLPIFETMSAHANTIIARTKLEEKHVYNFTYTFNMECPTRRCDNMY